MFTKSKWFYRTRFNADVVREAIGVFTEHLPAQEDLSLQSHLRTVHSDGESWTFDSDDLFFAAYRKPYWQADYSMSARIAYRQAGSFSLKADGEKDTLIAVSLEKAADIESVFDIFERYATASMIPETVLPSKTISPKIFIGHGRSTQWRDLKDHLTDKHGYSVIAYEVGARAGHTIRDILDEMLAASSFGLLVMTGEDEFEDAVKGTSTSRARQNVVHELGLFQGRLGFARAIAIVEEGVELFSNIDGVQQLLFSPGNIAMTYGDILATLFREFGDTR